MIKKAVVLLLLISLSIVSFSQKSMVGKAVVLKEEGDLNAAYTTIMKALDPENPKASKTINWARAWVVRGEILQEIGRIGMRNIVYEPLLEAHSSYMKAVELDTKGRLSYSIVPNLDELQSSLSTYGKSAYGQRRFDVSSRCFLTYMDIEFHPLMVEVMDENLDTVITYNAGLAAYEAKKWNFVIDYFKLAEKGGCNTAVGSFCIASAYKFMGDTIKAIETLQSANEQFGYSDKIAQELIHLYIVSEQYNLALNQLDSALTHDPNDIALLVKKGRINEKIGNEPAAIEAYLKGTQADSTQFTPFYNLGVIYFNNGVSFINEAIELPQNEEEKFLTITKKGEQLLTLCLPYFEKAYQLNPSESGLLKSLSYIYKQLNMKDKYEEAERKLKI